MRANLRLRQRREHNCIINMVEELRTEVLASELPHLTSCDRKCRVIRGLKPVSTPLLISRVPRFVVDDDGVLKPTFRPCESGAPPPGSGAARVEERLVSLLTLPRRGRLRTLYGEPSVADHLVVTDAAGRGTGEARCRVLLRRILRHIQLIRASSSPKRNSARAFASSVLPTPVGPAKDERATGTVRIFSGLSAYDDRLSESLHGLILR